MVLALSIGFAEAVAMVILYLLPDMSNIYTIFLDAAILLALISPALYFGVFYPLMEQIETRTRAEQELRRHKEYLEEMVNYRTGELAGANELLRAEIAERRQAEELLTKSEQDVRDLSSQLLRAQEIERKRIAMDLHDALGQALNVTKFQISAIESRLREDQLKIREECERLLEYMDHIIEEVRRISLDLSPTVLEDLGLSSALRWLLSCTKTSSAVKIKCDIDEIDHLIPESQWIVIYRIVQEAVNNVRKHAQAENVSLVARRHGDKVTFSLEDDGKGFDQSRIEMRPAPERGLGLATMKERIKMVDGFLDLWSVEGKGTRIMFTIPVKKEGLRDGTV
jgi:signal transduction histidine kinase